MNSAATTAQAEQRALKKAARRAAFIQEIAVAVAQQLREPVIYIKRQPVAQNRSQSW
jgi:hypothetical protein